jgi:TetR/AcrR family transcriptional regulator, mexCD-oprJ operon repressor
MNTQPGPAVRPYGRRADAERNRESVLDHATRLLTEDPTVGMGEIAARSGIGRATLYRHFATREELIEAIGKRAADETEHAVAASRLEDGTATEALHRLIVALFEIGDRYRFLLVQDSLRPPTQQDDMQRMEQLGAPVVALFERGQAAGEFSRSLPAAWMVTVFGAVIISAAHNEFTGRLDPERNLDIVTETLLHGLSGPNDG